MAETISVHRNHSNRVPRAEYLYDFSHPAETFDGAVQQLDMGLMHIFAGMHPGRFSLQEEQRRGRDNLRVHFKRVTNHIVCAAFYVYGESLPEDRPV